MPAEQVFGGTDTMDVLTFIVEMTKAAAWPALLGLTLLSFRSPLLRLLVSAIRFFRRAKSVKVGGVEMLTALDEVETIKKKEQEVVESRLVAGALQPEEVAKLTEDLKRISNELGQLQAWREASSVSAIHSDLKPKNLITIGNLWRELASRSTPARRLGMQELVERLSPSFVLAHRGDPAKLRSAAQIAITGDGVGLLGPHAISEASKSILVGTGATNIDGTLTDTGLEEMIAVAKRFDA